MDVTRNTRDRAAEHVRELMLTHERIEVIEDHNGAVWIQAYARADHTRTYPDEHICVTHT